MKILIDTNLLPDVALNRGEFFEHSAAGLDWAESSQGARAHASP